MLRSRTGRYGHPAGLRAEQVPAKIAVRPRPRPAPAPVGRPGGRGAAPGGTASGPYVPFSPPKTTLRGRFVTTDGAAIAPRPAARRIGAAGPVGGSRYCGARLAPGRMRMPFRAARVSGHRTGAGRRPWRRESALAAVSESSPRSSRRRQARVKVGRGDRQVAAGRLLGAADEPEHLAEPGSAPASGARWRPPCRHREAVMLLP